jgi:hypothetical protein
MYTQAYSLDPKSKTPLLDHCKVYVLAEKYDVSDLKNLARSMYEKSISNDWDNDWDDDDFIQSLRLMYDETPKSDRQLKDVAITAACHQKERLLSYEAFTTLMEDIGEIGVDMMKEELSWRTRQPFPSLPFISQYPPFVASIKRSSTIPPLTTRYTSRLPSTQDLMLGSGPNISSTTTSMPKLLGSMPGAKTVAVSTGPSISSTVVVNSAVTTSSLPNHYFASPAGLGPTPGPVCPNCNSIYNTWRFLNGKSTYKCHDCDTVF